MHKLLVAVTALALAAGSPACSSPRITKSAAQDAEVLRPVHQFLDGFNAGDTARAAAACTDEMSIIDELPPYEWHGAGALSQWIADYDAHAKQNGITDGVVTLGDIREIDIVADRAYVVASTVYDFRVRGQPVREDEATITFALHRGADGWRITGWAWSKN